MYIRPTAQQQGEAWGGFMRAAQAGDRAAYEQLLREIIPFIRSLGRRHCRNHADLEEMVQDTLLTVHRVRHTYDPARPFNPWLAAIASRRAIDAARRRQRIGRYETADPELAEAFSDAAANNDLEAVHAAAEVAELLQQLPPSQRKAVETLKLKEMSLAQAALVSGQSVGALKVNTHRALKALRGLMQNRDRR
ncbi:MAG: sigma-70 family RNA polymerase sigma factor [Steroidobacteraceae bacterium]